VIDDALDFVSIKIVNGRVGASGWRIDCWSSTRRISANHTASERLAPADYKRHLSK
jgi:hypothetical protein